RDAGIDEITVVLKYFVFEIPGQHVIRIRRFWYLLFQCDGNVHARRHQPLSKRILFNETVEKVGPDAEVVQQRISFDRRAESKDLLAAGAMRVEKIQAFLLLSLDVIGEAFISFKLIAAGSLFRREHLFEATGNSLSAGVG